MAGDPASRHGADRSKDTDDPALSRSATQHDGKFTEGFDLPTRRGSFADGGRRLSRANSAKSLTTTVVGTPSRGGTLKKKNSISRKGSLKRSGSRRLSRGSMLGYDGEKGDAVQLNSAFYTPVPTQGAPTAVLAERFEGSRPHFVSID
jgi:hypothetical protein